MATNNICTRCEHYLTNPKIEPCLICWFNDGGTTSYFKEKNKNYESDDKMVSHPDHYQTKTGLETIRVIEAFTDGLKGIEAVCTANVIKYICRWKKKNGLQDLKKAQWYLTYLINHVENSDDDQEVVWTMKEDGMYLNGKKIIDITNEALNKMEKESK